MTDPMLSSVLPAANPVSTDAAAPKAEAWRAAAEEFEAVFLAQMLATMTQGSSLQGSAVPSLPGRVARGLPGTSF